MKEIFKTAAGLWLKHLGVTVMCFFICISLSVLATAAFTENIGYKAYGTKEGSSDSVELYTYYNDSGSDTEKEKYEAEGYSIQTQNIRSELSKTGNTVFLTVTQLFCILMLVAMMYSPVWQLGCKDSNLVKFKHKSEDLLKGLKIGLIAMILPAIVFFAFVILGNIIPSTPISLYRFLNCSFYSFIQLIAGKASVAGDLKIWQYIAIFALLFIIPAITTVAYLLGYKDISLGERFIYKKNKKK